MQVLNPYDDRVLDDVVGSLIGGMVGDGIVEGTIRGRAKRKAARYLAGESISFRAHLQDDPDGRPRRGRLRVTPGMEVVSWTPWPRWRRPSVELTLLGGPGHPVEFSWGLFNWGVPGHAWNTRNGSEGVVMILLERSYRAAFAPILSLGAVPARSHRRRPRR